MAQESETVGQKCKGILSHKPCEEGRYRQLSRSVRFFVPRESMTPCAHLEFVSFRVSRQARHVARFGGAFPAAVECLR